ncbi:MAG: LPS assembly lipoprotein LptE [Granulosicoccaceae bacterium]
MLHRLTARLGLLASTLILSACGFHLVQPNNLQGTNLHVQVVNQGAPLASRTLTQELQLREITTDGAEPDIQITLRGEQIDNRLLAIDSDLRAAEYQLEHTLEASAKTGETRTEWQSFTATRDYTYDESNVLGKSQEQLLIRQTLREELAQRIVERFLYPARQAALAAADGSTLENTTE